MNYIVRWDLLKKLVNKMLTNARTAKYDIEIMRPCYVDAYHCVLHNMEHIEKEECIEKIEKIISEVTK